MSLVLSGVAWADNLVADGDGLTPIQSHALVLGSICQGESKAGSVFLGISRNGSATGTNTFGNDELVAITAGAPSDSRVTQGLSDASITLPGGWTGVANNTISGETATSGVTATAGPSDTGPASATITYIATGLNSSGDEITRDATLTVTWSATSCTPPDSTPPVITPNVSGTLGNNGWYTSDVTVSWTVSDPESTISSISGCGTTSITADTAGITLTCEATSAGGPTSQSVTIKRDATAPTISGIASPAPNADGWNNTNVTVSFTCDDNLSGVALSSCGPNQNLTGEGSGQSATGTATDDAGNTASATVSGINIDKTAPSVALIGGPADGESYYFGSVPAAPTCSASDALSGLDGPCVVSGYGTTVGQHTVTASATDRAGNANSDAATYTVLAWTLNGFYQPVDMDKVNTVKGGSTVPLKFEVFAGSTELTDVSVVDAFIVKKVSCTTFNGEPTDDIELTTTGGTVLRYDWTAGQFIQNWQTPKGAGLCYTVMMTTDDGSYIGLAYFKTK